MGTAARYLWGADTDPSVGLGIFGGLVCWQLFLLHKT